MRPHNSLVFPVFLPIRLQQQLFNKEQQNYYEYYLKRVKKTYYFALNLLTHRETFLFIFDVFFFQFEIK